MPDKIPDQAITFFAGPPGSCKSWLVYSLAIAVASGTDWMGFGKAAQGSVVVFNLDNPRPLLGRRMRQLGLTPDMPISFHSPEIAPFKLPQDAEAYHAIVEVVQPHLVIIDSFRQCHTLDENSSQDMSQLMGLIKPMRREAAVIVVHHTAKGGGPRGSTEIEASADEIVVVEKAGIVEWTKHRGWDMQETMFHYHLTDTGEGVERRTKVSHSRIRS